MSTVSVTNLKNVASASNNLVLDTSGNTTAAERNQEQLTTPIQE